MRGRKSWNANGAGGNGQRNIRTDIGLLVLRIGVSAFMLFAHGADKLVNFSKYAAQFPDPLGLGSTVTLILAVFAEFFCSLAIGFGFLTRLAAIPPAITMLVAAFIIHSADPWAKQEFALLYFIVYLTILVAGPGYYSIDRLWFNKPNGK
ncbi:MAG: DoxX family protein [Candidatus Zixiibacteriota bacterium]